MTNTDIKVLSLSYYIGKVYYYVILKVLIESIIKSLRY